MVQTSLNGDYIYTELKGTFYGGDWNVTCPMNTVG